MITEKERDAALSYLKQNAQEYAEARATRQYLEEHRKVLKAKLFLEAEGTVAEREAFALAHDDMSVNLTGLRHAIEQEQALLWKLKAAEIQLDHYRTDSASNRAMDRGAA